MKADLKEAKEVKASQNNKAPDQGEASACNSCNSATCSAAKPEPGESDKDFKERQKLQSRLCRIQHKIVVLSGKGGVGKSTVAVNLAISLAMAGKQVGLLDVDIHGPSIPTMLGLEGQSLSGNGHEMLPLVVNGVKVVSLGFLLPNPDDAVIWRGPMKSTVIKQFLQDVAWGDLDYLIIDSPPGTGDEPLSVCQTIGQLDGAVLVTTPQRVAEVDVRKSVTFCRQMNLPVLGVVENMNGFCCPQCGEITPILRSGGGRRIAESMGVPFLGDIPIEPSIALACDSGQAFIAQYKYSSTAKRMQEIIRPLLEQGTVETGAAAVAQ
jgi:Mrp family chromosome partitioning ATPase